MNRVHKTLWSESAQCWQAVPETAKAAGKRSVKSASGGVLATVVMGLALSGGAGAQSPPPPASTQLPMGGTVVRGSATISQTATAQAAAMTVNQSSQRAIINWDSFNLGSAASINFVQPNAQAVTLNRVNDNNPSQIFGRITSNGQVFLSNPSGVYFSPTASVDVGALVATSHSISDAHFMAGNYQFERNGATGKVVNEGRISAALGGYVALLAPEVQNAGVVLARAGTVALAAGEVISLQVQGGGLAGITTTPSAIATLIENKLAVQAPDGQIILSAVALNKLQAGVIKNSGSLEANSLVAKGGKIYLEADDITLAATSKIEAKGPTGGGTVLVGGDWQGTGDMRQATKVTMEAGASIDASATDHGDGGKVVLWSDIHNADSVTRVNGSIQAEAGPNGGNGGQVETSGHQLQVGDLHVSTRAPQGGFGEWLLDPYDLTISNASGAGTTSSIGTYTANANDSNVQTSALITSLNSSSVTISTGTSGTQTGNITLADPLSWTSGSALTLNAAGSIILNANIAWATTAGTTWNATNGGLSGTGNLSMTGASGSFVINQGGTTTYGGVISGAGKFTKRDQGALTLTGNNSYSGGTLIYGGTLEVGSATALGTGTVEFGASTGTLKYGTGITTDFSSKFANTATQYFKINLNGNDVNFGSAINSSGGILSVFGSGTLTLSGANTYTGGTQINSGAVLKLGNATPWGTSGQVGVGIGSALDLNGQAIALTNSLYLNGTGINGGGALMNSSSTPASYAGPPVLSGSASIVGEAGSITITNIGSISGATYGLTLGGAQGGALNINLATTTGTLTKEGTGTWTLGGGNNTYTGQTFINAGTVKVASTYPFATGTARVTVANGAVLDLNGKTVYAGNALTLNGSGIGGSGVLINSSSTAASYAGLVSLGSDASITGGTGAITLGNTGTITGAYNLTLGGALGGTLTSIVGTTTGGLTKVGAGTWTLGGLNTYSGNTNINAGSLKLNSVTPWGAGGTVTVANGATLDLNGKLVTSTNELVLNGSFSQYVGALSNSGISTGSYAGTITLGSASTIGGSNVINLTSTNPITGAYDLTLAGSTSSVSTITGDIATGTGGLIVNGSSPTALWRINGNNSYTGNTLISKGKLRLGSATPWGAGGTVNVSNFSTLDLNGQTVTSTNALTLNGKVDSTEGALSNSSTTTTASYAGPISLGSASTIGSLGGIELTHSSGITGNNYALTLNAKISATATASKIAGPIAIGAGSVYFSITNAASSWTFNGNNSYTGNTYINSGTLKLGTANPWGPGGTVSVSGTLDLNGQTVAPTNAMTLSGTLTNSSTTAASYGGLISLASSSSILGDAGTINLTNAGTISGAYGLTLGGAQGGTLASILGTTTGTLTKTGAGTWTLGGLNTFTGNATISAGLLKLGTTTPWGGTGTVSVASGAALDLNGQTVVSGSGRGLTLNGTGISGSGALFNSSSTAVSYGGLISLGSASSIVGDAGSISLSNAGTISGAYGLTLGGAQGGTLASILGTSTGTLTKEGAGTWTLGGLNTFTGNATISAGLLKLGSTTPWGGTGTVSVASGAALDLNGQTVVSGSGRGLTLNGTGISGSGALFNSSSTAASYGGLVTLGSATTIMGDTGSISLSNAGTISGAYGLTLGGAQGGTLASILATTTGTLTKTGLGTWRLSGSNTYTGATTISAGTLQLTGSISSSASVANNGTLDISGTSSGTTINLLSGSGGVSLGIKPLTLTGTSTFDGVISGTGGLNVAEFGAITLTADQTFTGTTTMLGNILGSSLTLGNGGTGGSLAGAVSMANTGSSLTVNRSNDTTLPGTISGLGVLKKFGTGTLTLSGTNSNHNGAVNINAGTLKLGSSTPWGLTATQSVTVSAGASLDLNGISIASTNRTLNLNGTGVNGGGALLNSSSTGATYPGGIILGSATSIVGETGTISLPNTTGIGGAGMALTVGGAMGGSFERLTNGSGGLIKAGLGTWTLTGANTYTGTTTINAGTLQVGTLASTTAKLGTGAVTNNANLVFVRNGGFQLSAMAPNAGAITGTGNVTVQGNGTVNIDRAITLTGANSVIKVLAGAASGANTSLVSDLTLTSTLTTSATGTIVIFAGSPTATAANGSTANLGLKMAGATGGIQYKTYNASSASLANAVAGTRNFYYRVLPSLSVTGATVSATKTYDGTTAATQVTVTGGSSTGSIDGDLMGFSATSANYASASAGTGIGLTVNLAAMSSNNLWVVSGYSGSLTGGTVSGTINKAPLVVKANDDARFVTQTDTVGYAGVSYSGWVNNETSAVLGGSLALARSSPGATAAGSYTLTPSGLTAANYDISYRTGSYTIVPANQLLVRVADSSSTYGNAPSYSVTSAKYVMPDNSLVDLTGNLSLSVGTYTLNDGASGNAQFALGLSSPTLSSAGKPSVGIWNVAASGATTTSPNFSNTLTVVGTQTITPRSLTVSAAANNKTYDGGVAATVTLSDNRVSGDVLSTSQTGAAFASKNAANGLTVTVNGITASGTDMANYTLANTSTTTTANITPKPLSLAGLSAANKVYDGTTSVVMNSYGTLSGALGIDDVQVDATGVSAAFATKAAGNGKTVNISGLIAGGADMGNYSLANPFTTTANITPKALSVSGLGAAASKVYDGNTSATLTGTASLAAASAPGAGNATDGLPYTGDALAVAGIPTGTYNSKDVASAANISVTGLSLSGADASNYSLSTHAPIAATITPKSLIVKANNDANFFALADTPGFNGVSYVGFVQNESASNLSFANGTGPVITSSLTTGVGGQRSTPGAYVGALTPSGVNAGNYTPSYQTGDFTVVPADRLMVRVSNLSVPYGSSSPYGTPSASYYSSTFGLVPGLAVTPSGNAYVITDPANGVSAKVTLAPVTTAAQLSQSGNAAVGTYNIDAASVTDVLGGASFNVVAVTGTQTVTQKALTLSATAANKTYDGSASASVTLASSDALTGDALTYNKVAATFADKNAGSAKTVSVTGLSLGGADAGNYILQNISAQTQADIARKQVQLAGTKTYDGGTSLSASQLSITTGVGTETLGFSAASIGSKNVADNASNRVTSLTLTDGTNGGLASNYTYTTVRGADNAVTINPASLTIAPVTAAKTYDGTQSSAVAVTISNNSGSADVVTAVQEFTSPNAMGAGGSSLQIKAGYAVVDSLNADMRGNYNITANGTATGTINKAALTVTANNASKTYGDANPTLGTTVSGFVNGETLGTSGVAGTGAATTTATTATGAGTATITAGVGSLTASNYDFSNLVNGTLTINKAALTVTANNASKTYGGANPTLSTTVSGFVNGETLATSGVAGTGAATTTATTATGAGTATITAGVGSLTASNYDFSNLVNGTLTINKAPLTVTANNASKTYGGANPTLSTTVSGFVNGETLATSGVAGTGAATTTATTATGAGTATITAGVGSLTASNYDFSNLVNGTLTINKAPLTVTANNASKTYGGANPTLSTTLSGFVNGETLATSGVAGTGAATTTATTATGAGTATITAGVGSLTASNYDFSNLVNGTLTINKAALTVTANNASKTYGGANPTLSTTVSGFVNGETLATSGVAGTGAATTTATTATGAGTATITAGVGSLTAANYDFSNLVNGMLTINKAPLTVTANNASKTYGDANPTLNTTVSGFVNNETLATSGVAGTGAATTTATTATGAGTATITAGVGSLTASNYDFSNLVNGTLTINKANLTRVTASKTYDGLATVAFGQMGTIAGVNGETFTATMGTASISDKNVATTGKTLANLSGLTLTSSNGGLTSNYNLGSGLPSAGSNNTVTITAANLPVSGLTASNKVYDGTATATLGGAAAISPIAGDTVTLSGSATGSFADANEGSAKPITTAGLGLSGADASNYSLVQQTGLSADITKAPAKSTSVNPGQVLASLSLPQVNPPVVPQTVPAPVLNVPEPSGPPPVISVAPTPPVVAATPTPPPTVVVTAPTPLPPGNTDVTPTPPVVAATPTPPPTVVVTAPAPLPPGNTDLSPPPPVVAATPTPPPTVNGMPAPADTVAPVVATLPQGNANADTDNPNNRDRPTANAGPRPVPTPSLQGEQVAYLRPAEATVPAVPAMPTVRAEPGVPPTGTPLVAPALAQAPVLASTAVPPPAPAPAPATTNPPATASAQVASASPEAPRAAPTVASLNAPAAAPAGTGVLAITILRSNNAQPSTAGVAFEQNADTVSLRATDAPPLPPSSERLVFNDRLTTFMVANSNGAMVEFQGSLVNNRMVIVAPSNAARLVAQTDMNTVLAAAVTSLGRESRVMLAQLEGVVLDLR